MAALPQNFYDPELRTSGVYAITCAETGKVYVGSAGDIFDRWKHHFKRLNDGTHTNPHLLNSWRKYGHIAFSFSVLELCPVERLLGCEQAHHDAVPEHLRFNIRLIVESNRGLDKSPETRAKLSAALKGRRPSPNAIAATILAAIGRKASEETRAKMREARKKQTVTPETLAKKSVAAKRWWAENPGADKLRAKLKVINAAREISPECRVAGRACVKGRPLTQEHRDKIRASNIATWTAKRAQSDT